MIIDEQKQEKDMKTFSLIQVSRLKNKILIFCFLANIAKNKSQFIMN
jgi:hypothetical protein